MTFSLFRPASLLACGSLALALATTAAPLHAQSAASGKKPALSPDETTYLQRIAKENLGEIAMSYLALEKSASEEVKSYAKDVISTHAKTMQQLMEMASEHDVFIPLDPDLSAYRTLLSHGGPDFDHVYAAEAQRINQQALESLNAVKDHFTSPDVKSFAQDDLKDDQEHVKKAQEIAGKLGPG